jgi:hypothetical protein
MRTFLRAHWKAIVAIILLVLLATVTVNPRAMPATPTPAAHLRTHVAALTAGAAGASADDAGAYIEHVLGINGYAVRRWTERVPDGAGRHALRRLEAVLANVAPGARALRTFIVGAHVDGAGTTSPADAEENASGTAAVLELARLLRHLRPGPGTEIRFVFFLDPRAAPAVDGPADALPLMPGGGAGNRSGNFIAYVGTLASSRQVQDALAAFQGVASLPPRGLAAPAYMQGVTLADRAAWQQRGGAGPALVFTDTAFTRFPYRHADGADSGPDAPSEERVYAGMARVVGALARTLTVLAVGQQG